MSHPRTFRLDRLYHQFLKPKGGSIEQLPVLAARLYEAGFIEITRDPDSELERYVETDKLLSREHTKELFAIVGRCL